MDHLETARKHVDAAETAYYHNQANLELSQVLAQMATAHALIAVAEELRELNLSFQAVTDTNDNGLVTKGFIRIDTGL